LEKFGVLYIYSFSLIFPINFVVLLEFESEVLAIAFDATV
jgi:hypothetical protein